MGGPIQFGDWQNISDLGSGAFGTVSLWKNIINEDYIAIKKCKFHTTTHLTEKQKERWNNEVQIMKIINHANIIKYKPIPPELEECLLRNNPTKLPLLPMEYCRKGNLRRILCKSNNICGLPEEDVRCILEDVCNGLQHLHRLKITHRDIKPDNIVLQHSNDRKTKTIYKIIDLGYAKDLNNTVVSFVGTLHYLAPEIFRNVQYNASVDYWSMGVLTFEVICGVLPFLPHLSPFERFDKIKDKGPDDICIYLSYSGQITYSSELKKENLISSCLKQNIEIWLRRVLQFDPMKRSEDFPNSVKVFDYLNNILKKKMINVFSIYKLEFYSYEISESTLVNTLKDWISRDIKISKNEFVLLFNKYPNSIDDSSLVVDNLDDDGIIFVVKKGVLVHANVNYSFPKLLRELFKPTNFDMKYLKQLYAQTVYYVTVDKIIIAVFIKGLSLFIVYLKNLAEDLRKSYANISQNLMKLLTKIECYYNVRKNNTCDIDLSKNCEYRDCLVYSQRLLASLDRSITYFKGLNKKIMVVIKKLSQAEGMVGKKKLIEDCNINKLYIKVITLIEKTNPSNKQNNGKMFTSSIKDVLSETIKIKDKLIHNKDFKSYFSSIAKVHDSAEKLKSWMVEYNLHLHELSKCFEQNQIFYRDVMIRAAKNDHKSKRKISDLSPSFDGELLKLPALYLIHENKELRYKFEDVLSQSILTHKNYVESFKAISLNVI